jgi:hypothetical protein
MSELTSKCEILDSEILKIETILGILNRKVGTSTNMEGFRQEIIDRFARIGFSVDVKTFSTNMPGTYSFDVQINDRIEDQEFDHDQMVHEVTNDILELGEGGVIKTGTAAEAAMIREASKHKHGG